MAFIDKKDPVVLNIKLTSKGRELLSQGKLNFKYYAIGDSEIDYEFNSATGLNPYYSNILRPADKNPNLLSFITRDLSGTSYNTISNMPSIPTIIQNTVQPLGFFNISTGSTSFILDTDHVKQPDAMVKIDELSGGSFLKLYKAPTYIANVNEPIVGDILLVKWTNPYGENTTGHTINKDFPAPYLFYKITGFTGSLSSNNLIVGVDRELPDFSAITGGTSGIVAGAMIYYNYVNFTGTTIYNDYESDYVGDAVTAFLQNCQCPTITFPFWNMSIIYTEDIIGIQTTDRDYGHYRSRVYGGFVSYIQNQAPILKKLGVIHYSNLSPSNTYAEQLYKNTPSITLPTIMWHKSTDGKLGLTLRAYGNVKTLTGATKSLNTKYYDLADLSGNIVGKIFIDLKLFVIEDQELLFAMSYKSNRSWTLPNYSVGINDNLMIGCADCSLTFEVSAVPPTIFGGSDGKLSIYNIQNQTYPSNMAIEVLRGTGGTRILFIPLTLNYYWVNNLSADDYTIKIYDLGSPNCVSIQTITLSNPVSVLNIYDLRSTASGLNPDFNITAINATTIRINTADVGTLFGSASILLKPYGEALSVSDVWTPMVAGSYVEFNTLSYRAAYTIYVKDSSLPNDYVWKDYIATESPFNSTYNFSQGSDSGGTYISVSGYQAASQYVIGLDEFAVYPQGSVPSEWIRPFSTVSNQGSQIKLYFSGTGNWTFAMRQIYKGIPYGSGTTEIPFALNTRAFTYTYSGSN